MPPTGPAVLLEIDATHLYPGATGRIEGWPGPAGAFGNGSRGMADAPGCVSLGTAGASGDGSRSGPRGTAGDGPRRALAAGRMPTRTPTRTPGDAAADPPGPLPALVALADGAQASAHIAPLAGNAALLAVAGWRTARGTRIAARRWRIALGADGRVRIAARLATDPAPA